MTCDTFGVKRVTADLDRLQRSAEWKSRVLAHLMLAEGEAESFRLSLILNRFGVAATICSICIPFFSACYFAVFRSPVLQAL